MNSGRTPSGQTRLSSLGTSQPVKASATAGQMRPEAKASAMDVGWVKPTVRGGGRVRPSREARARDREVPGQARDGIAPGATRRP
ncbi:hypothetical protein GCM10011392_29000 [Wenxinia marina]|nr:hypothetical protein GCM10011392_29000 [Wenxinia marina]